MLSYILKLSLVDIKNILWITAFLMTILIALFIYLKFAPVIKISILATRVDAKSSIINIEIENISKVRIAIQKKISRVSGSNILLQYFEHDKKDLLNLTEFLPFTEDWFNKKNYDGTWKSPCIIFETTKWIYPGEILSIQRPVAHNQDKVLHLGVQVHAKFGFLEFAKSRHLCQRWTSVTFLTN